MINHPNRNKRRGSEPRPAPNARVCTCGGTAEFSRHCGAYICIRCDNHLGLARCFCGWSFSGGDGNDELRQMGEAIEPDEY